MICPLKNPTTIETSLGDKCIWLTPSKKCAYLTASDLQSCNCPKPNNNAKPTTHKGVFHV